MVSVLVQSELLPDYEDEDVPIQHRTSKRKGILSDSDEEMLPRALTEDKTVKCNDTSLSDDPQPRETKTSSSSHSSGSENENATSAESRPKKLTKTRVRVFTESEDSEPEEVKQIPVSKRQKDAHNVFIPSPERKVQRKFKRDVMVHNFKKRFLAKSKETQKEGEKLLKSQPEQTTIQLVAQPELAQSSNQSSDEGNILTLKSYNYKEKQASERDGSESETGKSSDDIPSIPAKKPSKKKARSSPNVKGQRMSAKQAMDNMQKIKSESNRMLRERQVSLPYHRSKPMSLKEIMSRRRPTVAEDGKELPLKMNENQLKHYAMQLELRQKEMILLCKSDSEDELDKPATSSNSDSKLTKESNNSEFDATGKVLLTEEELPEIEFDSMEPASSTVLLKSTIIQPKNKEDNLKEIDSIEPSNISIVCNSQHENESLETVSLVMAPDKNRVNPKSHVLDSDSYNKDFFNEASASTAQVCPAENSETFTNVDSQLIRLNFNSEKIESNSNSLTNDMNSVSRNDINTSNEVDVAKIENVPKGDIGHDFSDDDIDMINLDTIMHKIEEKGNMSQDVYRDLQISEMKPKLAGVPGMVINLDGSDDLAPKKLSGVDLLKERFTYFARMKTPEEMERDKEKRLKPGAQHLKLRQELEDKIAEQRSNEWSKRLEDEQLRQKEIKAMNGDSSDEDELDKLENALELSEKGDNNDVKVNESAVDDNDCENSDSEPEDDLEDEADVDSDVRKIKKKNTLIDDEAEVDSDIDEDENVYNQENANEDENSSESSADEDNQSNDVSETETETNNVKRKTGRIIKAFEDSDDEDKISENKCVPNIGSEDKTDKNLELASKTLNRTQTVDIFDSQLTQVSGDVEMSLAQKDRSHSDNIDCVEEPTSDLSTRSIDDNIDELTVICQTQANVEVKFDDIVGMCSGSFPSDSNSLQMPSSVPTFTQSEMQSQVIGEDILALCTGRFVNNELVSPQQIIKDSSDAYQDKIQDEKIHTLLDTSDVQEYYKANSTNLGKENIQNAGNNIRKGKLVICSDDETDTVEDNIEKKKKSKKKLLQKRILHLSDDEEENSGGEEADDLFDLEDDSERIVEYDSEENEVEIQPQDKKKKKGSMFFEQEAELSSEEEWVGSGDEDESGLDRMEREAGDDETFHQGKLRRELGQIHMREVLDQDKREVRLLQEILLEDGDLEGGHRQRRFKWKEADGEEQTGTVPDMPGESQEEELESEEQWRKQRHERETFLRQALAQKDDSDNLNVSFSRTTLIKANLHSKTISSLLLEASSPKAAKKPEDNAEKKVPSKDLPSPAKKPFSIMGHFRGSLLARGRGSLERLVALAGPPTGDSETTNLSTLAGNKRNFVFATLSQKEPQEEVKVTKRKATPTVGTPALIKKLKMDDKNATRPKKTLLDHLNM